MAGPRKPRRGQEATNRQIFALHRYFIWTGYILHDLQDRMRTATTDVERSRNQFLQPYLPYLCAGLFVVVEGWNRLKMSDTTINRLLMNTENLKLLESYRHGVYHFHPEYYDAKFRGFWARGHEIHNWLIELWKAFDRFFSEWVSETLADRDDEPEWFKMLRTANPRASAVSSPHGRPPEAHQPVPAVPRRRAGRHAEGAPAPEDGEARQAAGHEAGEEDELGWQS